MILLAEKFTAAIAISLLPYPSPGTVDNFFKFAHFSISTSAQFFHFPRHFCTSKRFRTIVCRFNLFMYRVTQQTCDEKNSEIRFVQECFKRRQTW